jgi:FkbM family methyltransferase
MIAAGAPTWVRALGAVVRRMPRGRYRVVSSLRASRPPFTATLGPDAGGARFACDLSDEIAREVCLTGCYEPPVTRLLQRRLHAGAVMVDVGANWGYFTLVAAAAVGQSGRVLALEPDPRQFERLAENIRLNEFAQVTAIPAAAAARAGSAVLAGYHDHARNRGVSRIDGHAAAGPRFDVACVTIDDATATFPRVDVVKIDVEGGELDVLRGMTVGLDAERYGAIVLELHPELLRQQGQAADECVRLLGDAGYRGWTIDQSRRLYARAAAAPVPSRDLLRPLDGWSRDPWPHLLWLAPGENVR